MKQIDEITRFNLEQTEFYLTIVGKGKTIN